MLLRGKPTIVHRNLLMITHILFDLGGVMLEVEKEQIFIELSRATGLDTRLVADCLMRDEAFWAHFASQEHTVPEVAAWVNCRLGTTLSPEVVEAAFNAELGPPIDTTVQVLPILKSNFSVGCLSNTNSIHWNALLHDYEMMQLFDHRFSSQQLGCAKPNPRIYRRVEKLLNVSPEKILFFDDRAENIESARMLGWHARLYQSYESLRNDLVEWGAVV